MNNKELILACDVGTTSLKTSLFSAGEKYTLIAGSMREYPLCILENGGAEQNPEDWYEALTETISEVVEKSGAKAEDIKGLSFCSQMQGLVLIDRHGSSLRPAMSYMDGRAVNQKKEAGSLSRSQLPGIRIAELPALKLLESLRITGIAPTSVKDPIWKYHWVRQNEPEVFINVYKWLDVKEYLILRLTGEAVMTRDSAGATFLYDNRPGKNCWSRRMCRLYGVNPAHLPRIICSDEAAGSLQEEPAAAAGLAAGMPVFGGGGDASLTGLGAGATSDNDVHVYMGTSGWVSAVTSKRKVDLKHMIGSITCAVPGKFHYFSEQETAGKCMEWVCNHLALDEIDIYLEKKQVVDDPESVYQNLFEYLNEVVNHTETGSGGILFTPWLHGSRSPFEDPDARGMFFNIGLNTGKNMMIRAVIEGLAYNIRWMIESIERKQVCSGRIRFVGGGALSAATAQILADVTGRVIEVPENPQHSGALGAAFTAAKGLGLLESYGQTKEKIRIQNIFYPDETLKKIHERNYRVFKKLYGSNKKLFNEMNAVS